MSRVDDLIAEFCPQGVPFRTVGDVNAKSLNIKWANTGNQEFQYIDLTSVDRVTRKIGDTATITAQNAPSRAQQVVHTGDVIFATTRPTQMRWAVIPPEHDRHIASTGYCVLRPDTSIVLTNFLAHVLSTDTFRQYIEANQVAGNYPSIPDSRLRAYRIPVPPIEVQREIIRILDRFTKLEAELEAELKAELEARRRQYEHYQHSLLSFDEHEADWMTLGDIGRVAMCKRIFKAETTSNGDIPFYKIGTFGSEPDAFISKKIYEEYRSRYSFPKRGDILISAAGTIGRAIAYDGNPAYFQDSNIVWIDNNESIVSNAYLKCWYRVITWTTDGGTIRRLYNENIRRARIAVPPREEQDRIVEILNKLDASVNNLSISLSAELAARRKQYEYYRDRLLTFEEATV